MIKNLMICFFKLKFQLLTTVNFVCIDRINYNANLSLINRYSRKMILLSSVNRVFYPLFLFYMYLCIGNN